MKLGEYYEVDFKYLPMEWGIVPGTDLWYLGVTECVLTRLVDGQEFVGHAFCSAKDQFSRKEGRRTAFTHAINKHPDKAIRTELWAEYWKRIHR